MEDADLDSALAMRLDRSSAFHAQPALLRDILTMLGGWELTLLLPFCGICAHLSAHRTICAWRERSSLTTIS